MLMCDGLGQELTSGPTAAHLRELRQRTRLAAGGLVLRG